MSNELPEYKNPPVVETVLSVAFREISGLNSFQMGRLWGLRFEGDFPSSEEREPYIPPFERFDVASGTTHSMRIDIGPPPSRAWFVSSDGDDLVQLQRDWLAYNWRKVPTKPDYPHYPRAREQFERWFSAFIDFVEQSGLGKVIPTQCEVTYINHIDKAIVSDDLSKVLRPIGDTSLDWLPSPEGSQYASTFTIPLDGKPVGRLHIDCRPGILTNPPTKILRLELTGRGAPLYEGIEGVLKFQDLAHEWIVRGFTDITTSTMHDRWQRIQ